MLNFFTSRWTSPRIGHYRNLLNYKQNKMFTADKFVEETNNVVNCRVQWTDDMTKLLLAEIQINTETSTNFYGKLNKNVWKNIAASMNIHGYNLTADNCYIKWTSMKKKYTKQLKMQRNKLVQQNKLGNILILLMIC